MAAYASATDLIARKSAETIGDLVSDDGVPVPETSLTGDTKVAAALDGASGAVDAACLAGNRYTTDNLEDLTGNSLAYLKDIVCDLAMARLYYRKAATHVDDYKAAVELADVHIERLRKGERVFDVDDVQDAGTPSYVAPSVTEVNGLNLIVDQARRGFFPVRRVNV